MKLLLRIFLPLTLFMATCALTYIAVEKWRSTKQEKKRQDTIEGIQGLREDEVVGLPQLTKLNGERVALNGLQDEYLLFVFFSSRCAGCALDAQLWRDLSDEALKKRAAFYLINVGDDLNTIERFVAAHNLGDLPILFDPNQRIGRDFKVGFVPQYVLLTANGRVLKRWDGVRHYDRQHGADQLAEFFPNH